MGVAAARWKVGAQTALSHGLGSGALAKGTSEIGNVASAGQAPQPIRRST